MIESARIRRTTHRGRGQSNESTSSTGRLRALTLGAATVIALSGIAFATPAKDDELLKDEKHRLEQATKTFTGRNQGGSAWNIEVVGHNDLGGRGFNADVWTHEGFAYVGQWGFADWATGNSRFCPIAPNNGVAVVDATRPASPEW